ncbi:hypothetical protein SAY86_009519 [Trapa natans]|uniref:C3H1-type domain-containing protein n=1 Tax=Trapa natans TaxID=22666 RepID=A0AAN7KZV3_TRANT|nr:hypothetical protein SAY86_009519 [Trapa natans]
MKSQTYRTLSRIFALFDEQNQSHRLVKFVPCHLSPGSIRLDYLVLPNMGENTNHGSNDHGKLEDAGIEEGEDFTEEKCEEVDEILDDDGFLERWPCRPQMTLDEIAVIMSMDEDVSADLSKQMVNITESSIPMVNLEDNDLDREQMIIDELHAIVSGVPATLQDSDSIEYDVVSSDKILCGDSVVELENKQEHSSLPQNDVYAFRAVSPIPHSGDQSQRESEMFSFSPGHNVLATRPSQDFNSPVLSNSMPGADMELHKKCCVAFGDNFSESIPVIGDDKLDEGEFPGDLETEFSSPMHSENPLLQNEKHYTGQYAEDKVQGVFVTSSSLETQHDATDGILEWQERAANEVSIIPSPYPKDLVFYGDILGDGASDEEFTSEKQEIDVPKKRKWGTWSKERKEWKKKKEREKRTRRNKELDVKGLKLQLVQKPQNIGICRHFIHGRCWEGQKCKFSHDIASNTKSKPCLYFARHSCTKGDLCPFDHELSNYPCNNFKSKGFCNRGDRCMFSHKILPKPDDVSTKKRPERDGPSVNAEHPNSVFADRDKEETTYQTHHKKPETVSRSNKTLKWAEPPAGSPKPQNVFSANTGLKDTSAITQATSPSGVNDANNISAQGEEIYMPEKMSVKAIKSPAFLTEYPQQVQGTKAFKSPHGSISNSAEKVLSSTMASTQKREKKVMVKTGSASCSSTNTEATPEAELDDKGRAQKILDFLSSMNK